MNKNKNYTTHDEVDLALIIKILWKEKILILAICFIGLISGYLYSNYLEKNLKFTSEIDVHYPAEDLFQNISDQNLLNHEKYIDIFDDNLNSIDNLNYFSKKIYKSSQEKLFNNDDFGFKKSKKQNIFFLIYPQNIKGDIFLNDYIIFIKNKSVDDYSNIIKIKITNLIELYRNNLDISDEIGLKTPLLQTMTNNQQSIISEPTALYYRGSIILSEQIENLIELENNLAKHISTYEPILDKASVPVRLHFSSTKVTLLGLMLSIIFSLIIIFVKRALK